jgi:hypothetical protein
MSLYISYNFTNLVCGLAFEYLVSEVNPLHMDDSHVAISASWCPKPTFFPTLHIFSSLKFPKFIFSCKQIYASCCPYEG